MVNICVCKSFLWKQCQQTRHSCFKLFRKCNQACMCFPKTRVMTKKRERQQHFCRKQSNQVLFEKYNAVPNLKEQICIRLGRKGASRLAWNQQIICALTANKSVVSCWTTAWCIPVPGHALHEKGLQGQKGVGPLVSSQEQRALLVPRLKPRLKRGSTAGFVPPSVYIGFRLFVLLGKRRDVSSMLWRVRGRVVSWANSVVLYT